MASGIRMRSRSDYPIDVRDDKNVPDEFTTEQKEIMFGAWLHKACELAPAQATTLIGTAMKGGHTDGTTLAEKLLQLAKEAK
tara:strand:- start:433 stop:678 length:246 start_codon:yes stop_codon:yes gene_type:complete